jgi:SAM-dependent methyltransferase
LTVKHKVLSDFKAHWHKHAASEISPSKQAEARAFLRPLFERIEQAVEPMRILDVGCGDGVHAVVLTRAGLRTHRYCGIDLSTEAVRSAHGRMCAMEDETRAKLQVGDVLSLPYRSHGFDVVFSYGVLAYTGTPETALDEMIRVCKPGGLIGVWLYPKMESLGGKIFEFTRAVCHRLGRRLSKIIVYMIVPLLPILPVRSGVNLFNATWQQCVEVVEVNLLPEVLDFYTLDDVMEWFHRRDMEVEFTDMDRPIAVWARV